MSISYYWQLLKLNDNKLTTLKINKNLIYGLIEMSNSTQSPLSRYTSFKLEAIPKTHNSPVTN